MNSEQFTDDIYGSLKNIEREENVRLSSKAFIADFLSQKLTLLGYIKAKGEYVKLVDIPKIDVIITNNRGEQSNLQFELRKEISKGRLNIA